MLFGNEANCENVLQRQYHEDVLRLRQSGGRPTKRLFSYMEGDEYGTLEDVSPLNNHEIFCDIFDFFRESKT